MSPTRMKFTVVTLSLKKGVVQVKQTVKYRANNPFKHDILDGLVVASIIELSEEPAVAVVFTSGPFVIRLCERFIFIANTVVHVQRANFFT